MRWKFHYITKKLETDQDCIWSDVFLRKRARSRTNVTPQARGATYLNNIVHLVELVLTDTCLAITQERVPSKAGEGAALEPILDLVDVEGAILSMDALYTTKKIASLNPVKKSRLYPRSQGESREPIRRSSKLLRSS